MGMYKEPRSLPGFGRDTDTFVIEYSFPRGRQSVSMFQVLIATALDALLPEEQISMWFNSSLFVSQSSLLFQLDVIWMVSPKK